MRKLMFTVGIVLALASACCAYRAPWDVHRRPGLSLSEGAKIAYKALGADAKDYYCIGAGLAITTVPPDGDWTYRFSSNSGKMKWVVVDAYNHVQVYNSSPIY